MFFYIENRDLKKVFEWIFYIFIALFPFVFSRGYLFYGTSFRAVSLEFVFGILAVIFGLIILNKKQSLSIIKSPITISLFLFLVILFLTGVLGVDFHTSFWSKATRTTGIFYFLHLAIFYILFTLLFNEKEKVKSFLKVFLVSAGLFSIGSLLSRDGLNLIFTAKPWNGFTFGNSTFAAMYLYTAFMLSIYYLFSIIRSPKKWWYYLIPFVFVINPYILNRDIWVGKINLLQNPLGLIGEAQASSFSLFFSIVVLFIVWCISKIKDLKIRRGLIWSSLTVGLVLGGFAISSFLSNGGYLQKAYLSQSSNARPLVWELSSKAIKERPVWGWGSDNFDIAYGQYYDNRLLEQKNGGEAWFDRAHNIFIDQLVETGYVGLVLYLMVYLAIMGAMLYVLFKSKEKEEQILAIVLIVYFVGHLMELQTAFDTTISYVPLTVMAGLATILFGKVLKSSSKINNVWVMPKWSQYTLGGILITGSLCLLFFGTIPIIKAQTNSSVIRKIGSSEKRIPLYENLFGSPLDRGTFLWKTSTDLQRGVSKNTDVLEDPKSREDFIKEIDVITKEYSEYILNNKLDYRSYVSLASLYMFESLFGVDHLDKAHAILDASIGISPKIPQAYWMKSVTYLYQQKFYLAREWANKGLEINPNIEQSQNIVKYIDNSIKTFPEIDFYFFLQI